MGRDNQAFDFITIAIIAAIASFGLFLLLSIRAQLFWQQLFFLVIGVILLFVSSRLDGMVLRYFAPYLYLASIVFLFISFLTPQIRGASRWINLGFTQIQPSEVTKPFFLLSFATFLADRSPRKLFNLPILFLLFIVPFFLIFEQPDLGTSIVYASFFVTMLFSGGIPLGVVFCLFALVALIFPAFWKHLESFQKLRIITFLNPSFDPKGAGYNAFQAMIAVGSGQLFGRGLGRGTQSHLRFLPEYHTDFIFATLIEELGFFGGTILIALYGFLLFRIIRPFVKMERHNDVYFFYTIGLFAMILTQVFVNTGMNMGIIPITGITLPLVSYGGSSILSICLSFGFLWSLKRTSDKESVAI